jgi:hypothetical protein
MLGYGLECFEKSKRFLYTAANVEIVDGYLDLVRPLCFRQVRTQIVEGSYEPAVRYPLHL